MAALSCCKYDRQSYLMETQQRCVVLQEKHFIDKFTPKGWRAFTWWACARSEGASPGLPYPLRSIALPQAPVQRCPWCHPGRGPGCTMPWPPEGWWARLPPPPLPSPEVPDEAWGNTDCQCGNQEHKYSMRCLIHEAPPCLVQESQCRVRCCVYITG